MKYRPVAVDLAIHARGNQGEPRRGAIAVLAAVLIPVLLGFTAFAIDIGYILHARAELQRTADACVMAAIHHMPNESKARTLAKAIANDNPGTVGPRLEDWEIEFGNWNRKTRTFSHLGYPRNAIQVTLGRSAAKGNPLRLFFAAIMGDNDADVFATSVAMFDREACGALIGVEEIDVGGTPTVDSYNSVTASYNAQVPGEEGNLCSNGPIKVYGTAYVKGDANAGPGEVTTINGTAGVTGNTTPRKRSFEMEPVDMSDAEKLNDNANVPLVQNGNKWKSPIDKKGNFRLQSGDTVDLPPGSYYFNDLELAGGSTLNITGQTEIYLTGDYKSSGGSSLNNNTERPGYLKIFMSGGTATVTSDLDVYAAIYAPNTDVTVTGSSGFFGAIVGKTLKFSGTGDVHADESIDFGYDVTMPKRVGLVD